MAATKRWRLLCYDIRDPIRWRNVYRIVSGHGHRVQYSIYRARLDDKQVEELRWELSRVMDPVDALLIVDLCPSCASNVISKNHVTGWQDPVASFRVIGRTCAVMPPIGAAPSNATSAQNAGCQQTVEVVIGQRVAGLTEDGSHQRESLLCERSISRAEAPNNDLINATHRCSDGGLVHITLALSCERSNETRRRSRRYRQIRVRLLQRQTV